MANQPVDKRLEFKRDWVIDPPYYLIDYLGQKELAKVALLQLKAQHAILKVQEEMLEEVMEIYSNPRK